MQVDKRADERVAQYLRLDSCLFQTIVQWCGEMMILGDGKARRRGGAVARWRYGAMARWRDNGVVRWRGGVITGWRGDVVARWRSVLILDPN